MKDNRHNQTDLKRGLSSQEALVRLKKYGLNELKKTKPVPVVWKFLAQFNDVLIYILLVSSIISFALKEIADAIIIIFVILMNGIIGFIQEEKATKSLEALKKLTTQEATVKRDGILMTIPASELVVGDIIFLEEGQAVPADAIIFNNNGLLCDESALTGESQSVVKDENFISNDNTPLGDCLNKVYMSTLVLAGHSEAVVVATGMKTEIGKIASLLKDDRKGETTLQKKLATLGKLLGIVTILVCVFLFIIALIQKRNMIEMFITSISLAVAAVPEGLPAVVTIVLAIGVQRLIKTNMIVRKLHSVETLGAVSKILTDKTGTLTENQMTVVALSYDRKNFKIRELEKNSTFDMLLQTMIFCNNANIQNAKIGDPIEVAMLEFAKAFLPLPNFVKIAEEPFTSDRKMMSVLIETQGIKRQFSKGAYENIIKKCAKILVNGEVIELKKDDINRLDFLLHQLSSQALRVIALAYKESNSIKEEQLTFVGLVGMIDPPKKGVKEAVQDLTDAGIETIMITGDNVDTAFAIAKSLNIASNKEECVEGKYINTLSDSRLKELVMQKKVFARVSPTHKIRIVEAYKNNNFLVAMTGDGVNDAPSLREADVGIAMGKSGTDVAKNAADMILLDDNYTSIAKAVKEGRGIFANIKKTTLFLLSSNFAEIMAMIIGILFVLPIPLIAVHILWVNLITDSLPAIALSVDSTSESIMKEKPRKKDSGLFEKTDYSILIFYGIVITLITILSYCLPALILIAKQGNLDKNIFLNIKDLLLNNADILKKSRTFAFTTLGISQLFHMIGMSDIKSYLFGIIKKKNFIMIFALIIGILLQFMVTEIPILSNLFQTSTLSFKEWCILIALSSVPLLLHELLVPYFRKK